MSNEHTPAQRAAEKIHNCARYDCEICLQRDEAMDAREYAKDRQRLKEYATLFSGTAEGFHLLRVLVQRAYSVDDQKALARWLLGDEYSAWQPIETAPRDSTPVLLLVKSTNHLPDGRWYHALADIQFVGFNRGDAMEWCFSAPIGQGGILDKWIAGWKPLPPANFAGQQRIVEAAKAYVAAYDEHRAALARGDETRLAAAQKSLDAHAALQAAVKEESE